MHTLTLLGIIIYISFVATTHLEPALAYFNQDNNTESTYALLLDKFKNASDESKTTTYMISLAMEEQLASSIKEITYAYAKAFKELQLIAAYGIFMQVMYWLFIGITKCDLNRSAIYHSMLGISILSVHTLIYQNQNLSLTTEKIDLIINYSALAILLAGIYFKYRLASAILLLATLYYAYSSYLAKGMIGAYPIIFIALAIDASISIFFSKHKKRTHTKQRSFNSKPHGPDAAENAKVLSSASG